MNVQRMVAVDTHTGQPVKLSAAARERIEKELNAHDLSGLVAYCNAAGDVRYCASIVPYWAAKPRDAAFREDYERRLAREQQRRR